MYEISSKVNSQLIKDFHKYLIARDTNANSEEQYQINPHVC